MEILLIDAVSQYLIAARANGLSTATLKWYRSLLREFSVTFAGRKLNTISTHELRTYINDLEERKPYQNATQKPVQDGRLSKATVVGHVTALHAFWGWCHVEYEMPNRMARIKRRKPPQPLPKAISPSDFVKLFNATSDDIAGCRDRAILGLFADTGLRLGGLISLKVENVDLENRRAVVTEKGNKTRTIFFTKAVSWLLGTWLSDRCSQSEYLFTSITRGNRLTASGVEQILKRLKSRAGVMGRANPHSFRHRFALEYLKNGGDAITLAKRMGHENVNTTSAMYAILSDDELSELHEQRSPWLSMMRESLRNR